MTPQDSPQITTLIPTYRRPALLRRAILSAAKQANASVRICVFDNCSGDGTVELVRQLAHDDPRIILVSHKENIGPFANFDFALRSVTTPFFSILSDDDYLLPGFYERALAGLAEYREASFWAGVTLHVESDETIVDARVARWPRVGLFRPPEGALAMTGGLAPTWTGVLFRTGVLARSGYPDAAVLGPADLDFMIRLAASHCYVLEKFPAAVFTLNPSSFSATQPLSSFWPGWQRMIRNVETMEGLDASAKQQLASLLRADARRMLFRRGINALAAGRHAFASSAADALDEAFGAHAQATLMRSIVAVCSRVRWMQTLFARAYRVAESRLVRSRRVQHAPYANLLMPP